jgi:nitronate monooxygenase
VSALSGLGTELAVYAAPMAGGPTTPELVAAAARAGSFGFLGAGYLSAAELGTQLVEVRRRTENFGVNLFTADPLLVDRAEYDRYRAALLAAAERFGVSLAETPVEDDDHWRDKVDVLLEEPVPLVSFTFAIPDAAALAALRGAGSVLAQTVTSVEEARAAADAGMDVLVVQAASAGGHSGTFTPQRLPVPVPLPELVARIGGALRLPVIAAGGVAGADDVAAAVHTGAEAVQVGTALLLAPECGTSAPYRAALAGADRGDPVITRAFTGRPARGLRNTLHDTYAATAPLGYPAVHHLTRPIRRASAAAGDPEFVNLWAGTGYRAATDRPAAEILRALARTL